jgi:hypothetical protein
MDLWATDYSTIRPDADCSIGTVESVGEIRFYCREDTGPGPHRTKYPGGGLPSIHLVSRHIRSMVHRRTIFLLMDYRLRMSCHLSGASHPN